MRKLTIFFGFIFAFGLALQVGSASAQTGTGAAAKPSSTQSTTAKPPAAKPPASGAATQPVLMLKDQKEKNSYAMGMNVAQTVQGQGVDLDTNAFIQGVKDVLTAQKTLLTPDELTAVLTQVQTEVNARRAEKMKIVGDANRAEGAAFLTANKDKEGVVTLPSGLQYKILTAGTGPKPTAADVVICNYRGTLINGKEFDSSYKRGQPSTFPVSRVIKGWTEALQLMPVGSKWQLFIPAELAYADRGAGADIGPGATLIFEVELISIQGK
jgi:FKBP-type peptidyl-prolyl cis-trans isomerase FklB